MIMELGLVLIVVFVITVRSMQRHAGAVAGEAGTVAASAAGEPRSSGARTAASASLACAVLLPASLLLPPIPFHLEIQAPFAGIVLGVLAIVRLGNRFGSRWQVVAWLGVALSIAWILVVSAALALMLYQ
jgi:Ca2+/Na+ antiporter